MLYTKKYSKSIASSLTVGSFYGVDGNTDERLLNFSSGSFSDGFSFSGGAVKDGCGIMKAQFLQGAARTPISMPSGIDAEALFHYKRLNTANETYEDYLLAYGSDGYIYEAKADANSLFVKKNPLHFTSKPTAVF